MPVSIAETPKLMTRFWGQDGLNQIDAAVKHGAYAHVQKGLAMPAQQLTDMVIKSNLRGRGGAGFPTGKKWSFLPKDAPYSYLVVNADESEPGTCKDREILFWDPHLLIEGMILASYAINSPHSYIYIRGEMVREHAVLEAAVKQAYEKGYLGRKLHTARGDFAVDITVHRGAGAYICGEETSLLNSLEGKRGWPRMKPPFPAIKGLFGRPTIVNNVETIANVPYIVDKGAEWFAGLGTPASGGTRLLCVSGHVNKPGVFELPIGITARELINDVCGGVPGGKKVKAVIPGGVSMPPLDESELDVPIEFDTLQNDTRIKPVLLSKNGPTLDIGPNKPLRTMAGSGGVVVMDETADIPAMLSRIVQFFAHESCGQCTPCREGTAWLSRVLKRISINEGAPGDVELCESIAAGIAGNTICALGDAAAWPTLSFIQKFRGEFDARIAQSKYKGGSPYAIRSAALKAVS